MVQYQMNSSKRTFLLVLCVLTFLGSAFILLKNVQNYDSYNDVEDYFHWDWDDAKHDYEYTKMHGTEEEIQSHPITHYKHIAKSSRLAYLLELISCFGTILGAIIMLLRQFWGYIIYAVFTLLFLVENIWYWLFVMWPDDISEFNGLMLFFYLALPSTFLICYSTLAKPLYLNSKK